MRRARCMLLIDDNAIRAVSFFYPRDAICYTVKNVRTCGPGFRYSGYLRIQTYSEAVPLKRGKLATKYPVLAVALCISLPVASEYCVKTAARSELVLGVHASFDLGISGISKIRVCPS